MTKLFFFLVLFSGCTADLKMRIQMQDATIRELSKKNDSLEDVSNRPIRYLKPCNERE